MGTWVWTDESIWEANELVFLSLSGILCSYWPCLSLLILPVSPTQWISASTSSCIIHSSIYRLSSLKLNSVSEYVYFHTIYSSMWKTVCQNCSMSNLVFQKTLGEKYLDDLLFLECTFDRHFTIQWSHGIGLWIAVMWCNWCW